MYLSFLDTWKHPVSPLAFIKPADSWRFILQFGSWVDMNSSYSYSQLSPFSWLTCFTVFCTYLIISTFSCINRDYSYYSIQRIIASFLPCSITCSSVTYHIFISVTFYLIGCRDHWLKSYVILCIKNVLL